jgi:hypothetical protein
MYVACMREKRNEDTLLGCWPYVVLTHMTSHCVLSHGHKLEITKHKYVLMKGRNNVTFFRFSVCCVFSLLFNIIDNVKEVNQYCHPSSRFDDLPTSHRRIISSSIFRSKLFHFTVLIRVFQNFVVCTNQNTVDIWCDRTLNICLHNCILWRHLI